ncbi:xylulokinase [Pleomorphochaeta sp. DL1XJH-081]|uniref:xylulokinase n=1 Tax=Pleomorphochaeta sp. DL1XJH-081 TaxID=3409690 RepID=UPI003BB6AC27
MILSIDVGTTTCKGALFDDNGYLREMVKVPLSLLPGMDGAQEADPFQWSKALGVICSKISQYDGLRAIVVSGNGPTVVPVFAEPDNNHTILHADSANARLWLDRRAVSEAQEISQRLGHFVDSSFILPQVLHLSRKDQSVYRKSKWFLSSFEYMNYLLTGEAATVLHADDAKRWYWTEEILDELGLDKEKFPPFIQPGDLVGTVSSIAANTLGLPKGLPVFAAGPDFLVSILGCAVVDPSMVCDRSGTSEGINLCTTKPLADDRLMTYLHPVKPYYNVSGIISTSGKAIGWIKELFGLESLPFDALYSMMEEAPPGSGDLVFLPYLSGERAPIWDPNAKGVFSGLTLSTGRAEILRSVAEGVCLAMYDVIEVMEELGGSVSDLRITGGPSESVFLNQLKADVTGRPVTVPEMGDAELLGAMVIGRTSLGDYPSFADAARSLVHMGRRYEPDMTKRTLYDGCLERYRSTYRNLKESWRTQS